MGLVRIAEAGYNELEDDPLPLWLSSESVRQGIRALLDRDRCTEEGDQLLMERTAMQEWFSEEWRVLEEAIEANNGKC